MRVLVFDLDGTLMDSLDDIAYALNTALEEAQLPTLSRAEVRERVGHGLSELVRKSLADGAQQYAAAIATRVRELYKEKPVRHSKPYPGIVDLIRDLKDSNTILAVLSNKAQPIAEKIVEHFFPDQFLIIQGEEPGRPRKPDPEALFMLIEALEAKTGHPLHAAEIVLIGDSEADIFTARDAGVPAIGAAWGFRSRVELKNAGAQVIVENADELKHYLASRMTNVVV